MSAYPILKVNWLKTVTLSIEKPNFRAIFGPPEAQKRPIFLKSQSVLASTPISAHAMLKVNCLNNFDIIDQKPHFWASFSGHLHSLQADNIYLLVANSKS